MYRFMFDREVAGNQSEVKEKVEEFQPVGKLGEKVYYLNRVTEGEPYMLTKASASKRNSLRNYE